MVVFGVSLAALIFVCMSRPAKALVNVDACAGGATSSCHKLFPISQISSHESDPTFSPWVRQSQDAFQANNAVPSKNKAYVPGSSFDNTGRLLLMNKGRGRETRERLSVEIYDPEGA